MQDADPEVEPVEDGVAGEQHALEHEPDHARAWPSPPRPLPSAGVLGPGHASPSAVGDGRRPRARPRGRRPDAARPAPARAGSCGRARRARPRAGQVDQAEADDRAEHLRGADRRADRVGRAQPEILVVVDDSLRDRRRRSPSAVHCTGGWTIHGWRPTSAATQPSSLATTGPTTAKTNTHSSQRVLEEPPAPAQEAREQREADEQHAEADHDVVAGERRAAPAAGPRAGSGRARPPARRGRRAAGSSSPPGTATLKRTVSAVVVRDAEEAEVGRPGLGSGPRRPPAWPAGAGRPFWPGSGPRPAPPARRRWRTAGRPRRSAWRTRRGGRLSR